MSAEKNMERLIELMSDNAPVLGVAENIVRLANVMHNFGHSQAFCTAGAARNVFTAAVVLVARGLNCEIMDARLAVSLHMTLTGWTTPHTMEIKTITDRLRSEGMDAFAPYAPIWPRLNAGIFHYEPDDNGVPAVPFSEQFTLDIDKLNELGLSVTEISAAIGVPLGTIAAWKGKHRTPKLHKQRSVLVKTRAKIRELIDARETLQ